MRMRLFLLGTAVGTAAAGATMARRWYRTWGVDPAEAARPLPGDEVVPDATGGETRGVTIDAPPETVWPWLVQMGYGRAGWYSYDQLDQRGRSADERVDAWQRLAVGDIVPTHPGGGFEVVALETGRALVLKSDTALMRSQAEAAEAAKVSLDAATTGVKASGAMLSQMPEDYAASWAFVLEPLDGGRTRFIERFRVRFEGGGSGSRLTLPLIGFGVFVMMQKQMVGIRDRAERLARAGAVPADVPAAVAPDTTVVGTEPEPAPVG